MKTEEKIIAALTLLNLAVVTLDKALDLLERVLGKRGGSPKRKKKQTKKHKKNKKR